MKNPLSLLWECFKPKLRPVRVVKKVAPGVQFVSFVYPTQPEEALLAPEEDNTESDPG